MLCSSRKQVFDSRSARWSCGYSRHLLRSQLLPRITQAISLALVRFAAAAPGYIIRSDHTLVSAPHASLTSPTLHFLNSRAPSPNLCYQVLTMPEPNSDVYSHLPQTVRILTDTTGRQHRVIIFLTHHWGQDQYGWYYQYPSGRSWYYPPRNCFWRDEHSWFIYGRFRSSTSEMRRGIAPYTPRWHRCAWTRDPIPSEEQDYHRLGEDL